MILFFSDPHINTANINELEKTFQWILNFGKEKNVDTLVMLGDYYDVQTPHVHAFLFGAKWAKMFVDNFDKVIFVEGNHDNTYDVSNIQYLKYFGVQVVESVVEQNVVCGHFFVEETPMRYGKKLTSIKKIQKEFNPEYIMLGHYHDFTEIGKNAYHLGSCRYVRFDEKEDLGKYVALFDGKNMKFKKIPTVIPIKTVYSVEELDKIKKKTKVRMIFKSFQEHKENVNKLHKYKEKFLVFKVTLDFEDTEMEIDTQTNDGNIVDFTNEWLNKIEDKEVREILIKAFKSGGIL